MKSFEQIAKAMYAAYLCVMAEQAAYFRSKWENLSEEAQQAWIAAAKAARKEFEIL